MFHVATLQKVNPFPSQIFQTFCCQKNLSKHLYPPFPNGLFKHWLPVFSKLAIKIALEMQGFICRSAAWGACFIKAKRGGGNFRVSGSEFLRKVAHKWTVIFRNVSLRDLLRTCRAAGVTSADLVSAISTFPLY